MAKAKTAKTKTTTKRATKSVAADTTKPIAATATKTVGARKIPAKSVAIKPTRARKGAVARIVDDGGPSEPGSTSLVIVESPAKAKTIGKYLGRAYRVRATIGHVRDLPEKKMGIDIENGFEPEYVTIPGKEKTVADLKSRPRDSRATFLAHDPD